MTIVRGACSQEDILELKISKMLGNKKSSDSSVIIAAGLARIEPARRSSLSIRRTPYREGH